MEVNLCYIIIRTMYCRMSHKNYTNYNILGAFDLLTFNHFYAHFIGTLL